MRKYFIIIFLLTAINNVNATPISKPTESEAQYIVIDSYFVYAGIALLILMALSILILVLKKNK